MFGKYLQFRKASLSRKAVINTFVGLAYKLWKRKFFFPFKCFFHAQEMAFCWTLNDRTIETIAKSAVYIREVFRTLLNIYDGAFYRNTYMWCFAWFVTICKLLLTLLFTLSLTLRDFLMSALCAISFPNMRKKYCISHCTQRSTGSTHSLVLPP